MYITMHFLDTDTAHPDSLCSKASAAECYDVCCSDRDIKALVSRAMQQAGAEQGLTREHFSDALRNADLGAMYVSIDSSMY